MTAPSGSSPLSPFLSFVGPQDRSFMRLGLWLGMGVPMALFGGIAVSQGFALTDPALHANLTGTPPADAHPLSTAAKSLAQYGFLSIALAMPLIVAARLAFERPAWTFVSPARRFSRTLLAWGLVSFTPIWIGLIAIEILLGGKINPLLLSPDQPLVDKIIYVASAIPILMLSMAAQELVFRGVVVQVASAFVRTHVGVCVISALAFMGERALMGVEADPVYLVSFLIMSAAFSDTVLVLGGIEFSLGARFGANLVFALLESGPRKGPPETFHWSDLAKLDTWTDFAVWIAAAVAVVVIARLIRRWSPPKTA